MKFARFLLGGAAAFAVSTAAIAADVPARGPVYTKAPPAFSWEGQYIGIHGGYFNGTIDALSGGVTEYKPRGGFGGVQFGYLHHLNRNWVLGYEVDVSFGNIRDTVSGAATPNNDVDFFGTARTRLGYAQGQWLFYGTAGLAFARTGFSALPVAVTAERAQIGYAVGAGVEYAFAPNWSAKLEYLYMDLGNPLANVSVFRSDMDASVVRLGLNYRFANWSARPAADYPVKAPVRVSGWTGPYIGIHGGYGTGDYDAASLAVTSLEPSGGFFGIQSGYNWQLSRNVVFGLEGDASWGTIRDRAGPNTVNIDAMGTVRARLGYAHGSMLTYATGGLGWIHANSSIPALATREQFYLGWTGGAGIEYALSQRWSAKVEYLYSTYDSRDLAINPFTEDFKLHTIKVGLNYRAGILDFIGGRW